MKNDTSFSQKAEPATPNDLPIAQDLLDALTTRHTKTAARGQRIVPDALLDEFLSHVTDGKPTTAQQRMAELQNIEKWT